MRSSACKTWLGRLTTLLMAFALSSAFVLAQTKTVTGTVVDEMGEPVIGANVIVVGTTNGATNRACSVGAILFYVHLLSQSFTKRNETNEKIKNKW